MMSRRNELDAACKLDFFSDAINSSLKRRRVEDKKNDGEREKKENPGPVRSSRINFLL